jgi:phosphoglucan,water dikinase
VQLPVQPCWENWDGQFNDDFVNEFKIFHAELKRFFNCAGALERVDALRGSVEEEVKGSIDELQGAMWALDGGEAGHDGMLGTEGQAVLRALRAATAVRAHFTGALSTGMRNDAPDDSVSMRQSYRLAEIALEELAFVVMARAAACAGAGVEGEGDGGAYYSGVLNNVGSEESRAMWTCSCEAAAQGLRQMALSTWRPMECNAAARELEAWCAAGNATVGGGASCIHLTYSAKCARFHNP